MIKEHKFTLKFKLKRNKVKVDDLIEALYPCCSDAMISVGNYTGSATFTLEFIRETEDNYAKTLDSAVSDVISIFSDAFLISID